jgi:GT2 family glycosyltransferase
VEPASLTPGLDRSARPRNLRTAVVVIGRNEGERLRASLSAVAGRGTPVVYVDSGSRDGSPALARSLGCSVVELDLSRPLSAARARNEGFEAAMRLHPDLEWIQFLDGDCALAADWLDTAVREIEARPEAAVVCGRLREKHPEASLYNRLCELEWDRPAGDVWECGGIMLVRNSAFRQVGGFDARIVAGEDPEFCLRLRRAGWKIHRLGADMAVHDAAMVRFSQWWTRSVRTGVAYAQASALHGRSPDRWRVREVRSIRTWALWLPLMIAALAWPTQGWSLLALGLYPLQSLRIAGRERRRGVSWSRALLYGVFCMGAKWPQFQGLIRFWRTRRQGPEIIEYKGVRRG